MKIVCPYCGADEDNLKLPDDFGIVMVDAVECWWCKNIVYFIYDRKAGRIIILSREQLDKFSSE
jgi:hypothetical protein